jgi:hypothetical protein
MKSERNRNAEKAILTEGGKLSQEDKAAKAALIRQRATDAQVAKSGRDSRIKGHTMVQNAHNQGKRDAKQG